MRHGHAEAIARRDEERRLTTRGRENVASVVRALERLGARPTLIVASPLERAQQTAAIAAKVFTPPPPIVTDASLVPEGHVDHVISALPEEEACVLIVSHMPLVGELLGRLVCASSTATIPLSTSGAVWLEISRPASLDGRLRAAMSPRPARAIAQHLGDGSIEHGQACSEHRDIAQDGIAQDGIPQDDD